MRLSNAGPVTRQLSSCTVRTPNITCGTRATDWWATRTWRSSSPGMLCRTPAACATRAATAPTPSLSPPSTLPKEIHAKCADIASTWGNRRPEFNRMYSTSTCTLFRVFICASSVFRCLVYFLITSLSMCPFTPLCQIPFKSKRYTSQCLSIGNNCCSSH